MGLSGIRFRWIGGIVVVLAFAISGLGGYLFEWEWTGIVKDTGFSKRTLWEVADLLIVPAAIAGGVAWFNQRQQSFQNEIENQRAERDVLRTYLDQMATLLLEKELRKKGTKTSDVRRLARARTLTTLDALDDSERQRRVLRFLYETELIQRPGLESPVISLQFARLRGVNLSRRRLLQHADLRQANLTGADLTDAYLTGANLAGAKLIGARLIGAKLTDTILTNADLTGADLTGAEGISQEDLEQVAKSLRSTTMPDGSKHS